MQLRMHRFLRRCGGRRCSSCRDYPRLEVEGQGGAGEMNWDGLTWRHVVASYHAQEEHPEQKER